MQRRKERKRPPTEDTRHIESDEPPPRTLLTSFCTKSCVRRLRSSNSIKLALASRRSCPIMRFCSLRANTITLEGQQDLAVEARSTRICPTFYRRASTCTAVSSFSSADTTNDVFFCILWSLVARTSANLKTEASQQCQPVISARRG